MYVLTICFSIVINIFLQIGVIIISVAITIDEMVEMGVHFGGFLPSELPCEPLPDLESLPDLLDLQIVQKAAIIIILQPM